MDQRLPEHVRQNRIAWDTWAVEFPEWARQWPCGEIWKARKQ